jgi:hypothetical protein
MQWRAACVGAAALRCTLCSYKAMLYRYSHACEACRLHAYQSNAYQYVYTASPHTCRYQALYWHRRIFRHPSASARCTDDKL